MWREAWKEQMLIAENMIKLGLGSSVFISSFERQVILDVRIMLGVSYLNMIQHEEVTFLA